MTEDDIELARMTLAELGGAKDIDDVVKQAISTATLAGNLLVEVVRLRTLLIEIQTRAMEHANEILDLGRKGTGPVAGERRAI